MFRRALAIAALLTLTSSLALGAEPAPHADEAARGHGDHSQAHLVLAGLVSAAFLVFGALAGRKNGPPSRRSLRGGPASRSMRPSSRRPLEKS
jgi:hypothetical protein